MTDPSTDDLEAALSKLAEQGRVQQAASRADQRQRLPLLRIGLAALLCLALVNLHFIYLLTLEFRGMIHSMVSMYEHFGGVADRMDEMTVDMVAMENEIRLMPIMTQQTASMRVNILSMASDMDIMARDVERMRQRVAGMNQEMAIMAGQFHQLNASVGAMGIDVRQMSNVVP